MGFEQNPSSAEAIATEVMGPIRELAMAGDPEAQFLLDDVLAAGRIVRAGPEEAAYWYRLAAESGHVLAARALGRAYAAGTGAERSDSAALSWWRRAAEAGDAESLRSLRALERGSP